MDAVEPVRKTNPISTMRPTATDDDRRDANRIHVEDLACDRGEILDLSQTGARLLAHRCWKEGKTRLITFSCSRHSLTLRARSMWSVKEGFLRHVVGLHFEGATPGQLDQLGELARIYAARTMGLGYRDAA